MKTSDFQILFEQAPGLFLALAPDLRIVAVSDAYLSHTMTERQSILGQSVFEVFPQNPADPFGDGVEKLSASFERVRRNREIDVMEVQRYDIPKPESEGGGYEVRYWTFINSPVRGADGALEYIIHRAENVTEFVGVEQAEVNLSRSGEGRDRAAVMKEGGLQGEERSDIAGAQRSTTMPPHERLAGIASSGASASDDCQKAQGLNAVGGMLIALAHEIQQPIAAVALCLETVRRLLQMPPQKRIASVEEIIDKATAQIERAGEIIGNLRDLSPNVESDRVYENLHKLIEEANETVGAAKERNIVRISLQLDAANDRALIDRIQMKQVLISMLRDAMYVMRASENRELSVSTSSIEQNAIRIDVRTGSGISDGVRAFLIEPFMSAKSHGMPLSLLLSRAIIHNHYGKIWVEPSEDGGVTFSIALPLAEDRMRLEDA